MLRRLLPLWCAALLCVGGANCLADRVTPPAQPQTGPGGSTYPHGSVTRDHFGGGVYECWTFTPADPTPAAAPVVIFCHGWMAMQPWFYEGWITHLVRRGNIFIYPRFQTGTRTPAADFAPNAAGAVREALARLRTLGRVLPDLERVAVAGHSVGGLIATDLAVRWSELAIPRPRVLFAVEPGGAQADNRRWGLSMPDVSKLAQDLLLVCLSGEDDHVVSPASAQAIAEGALAIPAANRAWLVARTDRHSAPPLVADHSFPTSPPNRAPDALDFNACWKLLDGLLNAAFCGTDREYALGNTPQQRSLGAWSDGTPAAELVVRLGL